MGWQTIDTAPKDGTIVDLFVNGFRETDCFWGESSSAMFGQKEWVKTNDEGWTLWVGNPTHWMPLPTSPLSDTPVQHE